MGKGKRQLAARSAGGGCRLLCLSAASCGFIGATTMQQTWALSPCQVPYKIKTTPARHVRLLQGVRTPLRLRLPSTNPQLLLQDSWEGTQELSQKQ